jgi:hypothetical protein
MSQKEKDISKAGIQQEHVADTSKKKDGVTSSFSAATGEPGKYSGEDISDVPGSTGDDEDKIADRTNDEPAV